MFDFCDIFDYILIARIDNVFGGSVRGHRNSFDIFRLGIWNYDWLNYRFILIGGDDIFFGFGLGNGFDNYIFFLLQRCRRDIFTFIISFILQCILFLFFYHHLLICLDLRLFLLVFLRNKWILLYHLFFGICLHPFVYYNIALFLSLLFVLLVILLYLTTTSDFGIGLNLSFIFYNGLFIFNWNIICWRLFLVL